MIPKAQQPDDEYLSYFKLTLFDPSEFTVLNTKFGFKEIGI